MKKTRLFAAAAAMALAIMAAGCGNVEETSSSMFMDVENEKEAHISMENATTEDGASSGALLIEDGEELVVEPSMEKGKVLIQFKSGAENDNADELPNFEDSDYEIEVEGSEALIYELEPGEYDVNVSVEEQATGTITLRVQAGEIVTEEEEELEEDVDAEADGHTNWTEASSAEEAAQGAGIDSMADMNGVVISMGEFGTQGSVTYRYMDGIVQQFCPIAAVEASVVKGRVPAGDGDVSFDNSEYAHEWTMDVDGQEVQCYGNREGEATKTIWTDGEYNYAITAYGAGGDDDYGLQADDLAIMVKAIK